MTKLRSCSLGVCGIVFQPEYDVQQLLHIIFISEWLHMYFYNWKTTLEISMHCSTTPKFFPYTYISNLI